MEDSTGVKILIIADPYKSRPYYKVIRIKDSEVKKRSSYDLTPDSPKPDTGSVSYTHLTLPTKRIV